MAKINVREKGKGYELKVAKILSAFWGEKFNRTPCSGALRWGTDNRIAGDIVCPPESLFPFSVECKCHEGWTLEQVLKGTGEAESWWHQCMGDCERVNRKPLLIFSKNFAPNFMMILKSDFDAIAKYKKKIDFNFFIVYTTTEENRVICNLDEFVKCISKEDILKAYNL